MNLVALSLVFVIVVLGLGFSFISIFGFGKTKEMDMIISRDVYSLDNALEAAKYVYARNALTYSFYQAAYNASLQGGRSEPKEGAMATEEEFRRSLSNLTLEYYNGNYSIRPVNYLGYSVTMPDYDNITITEMKEDSVTMEAYAQKPMEVTSEVDNKVTKEKVTIRKNASMRLVIPTVVYKIYKKAVAYSSGEEVSLGNAQHELNKWPLEGSADMEWALTKGNDNDVFYTVITHHYPQLIREAEFRETTAMKDAEAIIASQISLPEGSSKTEDGFLIDSRDSSVKVTITPSCIGYTYVQDGQERSHKECGFSYKVWVSLKTAISEQHAVKYPVFNGERVSFEPLKFVFAAEKTYERKL